MGNKNSVEVYVVLRDKGTIFSDHTQDVCVTGGSVVKFKRTEKVAKALRAGVLKEVDKAEFDKQGKPAKGGRIDTKEKESSKEFEKGKSKESDKDSGKVADKDSEKATDTKEAPKGKVTLTDDSKK